MSPFKLALVRTDDDHTRVFASLYELETGVWGNLISTEITPPISLNKPSILVGNALCWLLLGGGGILEFDLDRQSLAVIKNPMDAHVTSHPCFQILRTEDRGIGFAILSELSIQLWERKANFDGVVRLVLQKSIELDKLLSLGSWIEGAHLVILGFAEDANVILLLTAIAVFIIQLESMQFRNLFKTNLITTYYPYTSFYAACNGSTLLCKSNKIQLFYDVVVGIPFMCLRVD